MEIIFQLHQSPAKVQERLSNHFTGIIEVPVRLRRSHVTYAKKNTDLAFTPVMTFFVF